MTNTEIWAARVAEWRASGLTATKFCEGKDFSRTGLYNWASKLERENAVASQGVRIARVFRQRAKAIDGKDLSLAASSREGRIEIQATRVLIPTGIDRAALEGILGVFVPQAGAAR